MNKTAIKNYAIWARNKLISDIEYKAGLMGITEKGIAPALPQSTNEVQFFDIGTKDYATMRGDDIRQRESFIAAVRAKEQDVGYAQAFRFIVEKVAYTWFNRLVAIRFMEVNDYLPSRVRVLSSENPGKAEPDMVTRPFDTDMTFTHNEEDLIMRLKDENKLDELFRWLFIKQCKKLHDVLPVLFSDGQDEDYLELLLTISFTDKDGVLWHLVHDIPEDDFNVEKEGQVEIIGWMYQYYNTEPKDQVFADLKKNIKISKDKIPAATQLFTPDWIVRYMVENSLGRLWAEGHPNEELKKNWKYYLEEAEQEPEVQAQLDEIRKEYAKLRPEEIKVIDPCMGSGHILVYLFDVLMQIYESQGWTQREAAQSIVQNNLYGLDIDERAAQLAYFAVMMKARQYDRRFLERGIEPHVYEIRESNGIDSEILDYFAGEGSMEAYFSGRETPKLYNDITTLMKELRDAKEYGSILNITKVDFQALYDRFDEIKDDINIHALATITELLPLIKRAEVMAQKYDVVVTNPPYMGSANMSSKLYDYIMRYYANYKSDLFAVFILRAMQMTRNNGFYSLITQQAWMNKSSYRTLRPKIYSNLMINLIHLGPRAFDEIGGEVVQTVAFIQCAMAKRDYYGTYISLEQYGSEQEKRNAFLGSAKSYICKTNNFEKLPNIPVAYWVTEKQAITFSRFEQLEKHATACAGLNTSDNNRFVRFWHEVEYGSIGFGCRSHDDLMSQGKRYALFNKGGGFRKWYGNQFFVIKFDQMNYALLSTIGNHLPSKQYYFRPSITWNRISSAEDFSARICEYGFAFDDVSPSAFCKNNERAWTIALMNSTPFRILLCLLNRGMKTETGNVQKIPFVQDESQRRKVEEISLASVQIAKSDWDSFEASWDFKQHPLIDVRKEIAYGQFAEARMAGANRLSECYKEWESQCERRFMLLKQNEEELNRIFIEIYGLQDELTPEVEDKDVTVRRANLQREIKSLLSYAVGCMFGRYSPFVDGLQFAGGDWNAWIATPEFSILNSQFSIDPDNCIPITDEPYFEDDIVGRFVEFIRVVYGADTLEENLTFVANALGTKGTSSREMIRNYFLNGFYTDHVKTYQKRPIYWLFDSGKQNGFKALVYMHRWNADTIGNVRVEYLHKMQKVYEKEIERMQDIIDNSGDNREIAQATKRKEKLVKQLKEAHDYDAKIAHAALSRIDIDLDDGVKVNYEKVQKGPNGKSLDILAKI